MRDPVGVISLRQNVLHYWLVSPVANPSIPRIGRVRIGIWCMYFFPNLPRITASRGEARIGAVKNIKVRLKPFRSPLLRNDPTFAPINLRFGVLQTDPSVIRSRNYTATSPTIHLPASL